MKAKKCCLPSLGHHRVSKMGHFSSSLCLGFKPESRAVNLSFEVTDDAFVITNKDC